MRILLIAMSNSIHTARWVRQVSDQRWQFDLFPSIDCGITHPDLRNIKVHHTFSGDRGGIDSSVSVGGVPLGSKFAAYGAAEVLKKLFPHYLARRLARFIKRISPDIIHSMEIQHAGYLTLEAMKLVKGKFPPWIVSNWGSDISLFGRLKEHEQKIREVLTSCDYYHCECERDVKLARSFGFQGAVLPVFPNAGGFDINAVSGLMQPGPVSHRSLIMLKGYQHWAGRALVGLRALERCKDILGGYTVVIYSSTADVEIAAKLFQNSTGISVKIISAESPHKEILYYHGHARVSIGLSIGDAASTSMLEAIAMGSFPIQSWTACADEWIEDGRTGILVHPEDPDMVEQAIRKALADDRLVDKAAEENGRTVIEKLEQSKVRRKAIELYAGVAKERGIMDGS